MQYSDFKLGLYLGYINISTCPTPFNIKSLYSCLSLTSTKLLLDTSNIISLYSESPFILVIQQFRVEFNLFL